MKRYYYKISLLILLASSAAHAAEIGSSGILTKDTIHVAPIADYFVDASSRMNIGEISSPGMGEAFEPNLEKHFSFGLSPNANWIRFRIGDLVDATPPDMENLFMYFNSVLSG